MQIDVGLVIAGKYELVRLIGKGAMGEVWLATHNTLGGEFAIKLVEPSEDGEDETASGRFQLEAQVSAKLSRRTRHIVSVSDHGEENGLAYLVMEPLVGESLDARLKRTGALPLPEVVAIVGQIARALAIAHAEEIFHRDLKPANIFLTHDEDGRLVVKLLDFGIARTRKPFRTRSPFSTSKDMVLGTPSYMSPEQARGLDTLDYRCDIWALAVVAYEALALAIPWEGATVEDIFLSICTFRVVPIHTRRPDLPPWVDPIFRRAFAEDLGERFATATELAEALEQLVPPESVDAAIHSGSGASRLGSRPGSRPASRPASRAGSRPGSRPSIPQKPSSPSHPALEQNTSDPAPLVGDPTRSAHAHEDEKKRSNGWVLGLLAAFATVGLVALVVVALGRKSTSEASAATAPPPNPSHESLVDPPPPSMALAPSTPDPAPPPTSAPAAAAVPSTKASHAAHPRPNTPAAGQKSAVTGAAASSTPRAAASKSDVF
ncbi:Serine/threonine protein kinase [Labilithrix luteola]|uniref:Serine/threonine protein kinase n=1 Tax=Labilithrix luteola TaxID=1391654 RepID=A0A0K1PSW7_9BACT|nr:serine/threonine-protein kinase [Labilithrix luteola]AKU96633.1 Serine/threonine protein kinase [Labilithrix luteola]